MVDMVDMVVHGSTAFNIMLIQYTNDKVRPVPESW